MQSKQHSEHSENKDKKTKFGNKMEGLQGAKKREIELIKSKVLGKRKNVFETDMD